MDLTLRRFEAFRWGTPGQLIGPEGRLCFAFEVDPIPPARYLLALWPDSEPNAQNARYANNLGPWHKGLVWVPGASAFNRPLFLHRGDVDDDGGIVVCGSLARGTPSEFSQAYRDVYTVIANAIVAGKMVWLNVPH